MAVNINIDYSDHRPNSQLPANTLNSEINNVLKFYKSFMSVLNTTYYPSYSAQITKDSTEAEVTTVIGELLAKLNNLTGDKGIEVSGLKVQHTNSITPTSVSSGSSTISYGNAAYFPNISIDSQGHVTSLTSTKMQIDKQNINVSNMFDGNTEIGSVDSHWVSVNTTDYFIGSALYEFVFLDDIGTYQTKVISSATIDMVSSVNPLTILFDTNTAYVEVYMYQAGQYVYFKSSYSPIKILKIRKINLT